MLPREAHVGEHNKLGIVYDVRPLCRQWSRWAWFGAGKGRHSDLPFRARHRHLLGIKWIKRAQRRPRAQATREKLSRLRQ